MKPSEPRSPHAQKQKKNSRISRKTSRDWCLCVYVCVDWLSITEHPDAKDAAPSVSPGSSSVSSLVGKASVDFHLGGGLNSATAKAGRQLDGAAC